jgi:hypothetical protein
MLPAAFANKRIRRSRPWFALRAAERKPGVPRSLIEQVRHGSGADRPAALADGEAEPGLERDGLAQLDGRAGLDSENVTFY